MVEKLYLDSLEKELSALSPEDRHSILDDYKEHFRQYRLQGSTDEETARALGSPADLARSATEELGMKKDKNADSTASRALRFTVTSLSLLFFNVVIVLGPYAGIVGALAGMWAASLALIPGGLAAMAKSILPTDILPFISMDFLWWPSWGFSSRLSTFFAGIALIALGLLMCIGMVYVTRFFIRGTVRYARMMWRIMTK